MADSSPATESANEKMSGPTNIKKSSVVKTFSKEELIKAQHSDEVLAKIISDLQEGKTKPSFSEIKQETKQYKQLWQIWTELTLHDGVLYRVKSSTEGSNLLQIVVPVKIKTLILQDKYRPGLAKELKNKYYWPGYRAEINSWCRAKL